MIPIKRLALVLCLGLLFSNYSLSQVTVDPNTGAVIGASSASFNQISLTTAGSSIGTSNNASTNSSSNGVTFSSTGSTGNLINPTGWTGVTYTNTAGVSQCCTGGPNPAMNQDTNTIRFSYGFGVAQQAFAINSVLSGKGIYVSGFNYSFVVDNERNTSGTLYAGLGLTSNTGSPLESYMMNLSGNYSWQKFSGTQNFSTNYSLSTLGNLYISFAGQDDRYWAGYYGPRVRDPSLSLNYGVVDTKSTSAPSTVSPSATNNQVTQAAMQSTTTFSTAATTDTSSTDNKSTGSQTVGGVGISSTGNINTLGSSIPTIVSNSSPTSSSNQPTQQSQPSPAPAQSAPAPAGPAVSPTNSPVQQAGPANNQQQNPTQQAKAGPTNNQQQNPTQQAKAGPAPQQNQQAKAGPQPGPTSGGPNENKPGQPGPQQNGPNNKQDMAMQVLDNMTAQAQSNTTTQDSTQQSQSLGTSVDVLNPYKAQASVVNNAILSKNIAPVTSNTSTAMSSQTNNLIFTNQQQNIQQSVQQIQQQQQLWSIQTANNQAKLDTGAINLAAPIIPTNITTTKNAGDPIDITGQNKIETQTTFVEQKIEQLKKNVEPNDLAIGVSLVSMATQPIGFDTYGFNLKDAPFYAPKEIYKNQQTVDNVRALRQLASDRKYQEILDMQYNTK